MIGQGDENAKRMNRHVYGPVPSRRLGRSLGVSLVPPKTCTYSCVYCQLGRTTLQTMERRSYFPPADVLREVLERIDAVGPLDHITLAGDGEPTLSSDLGLVVDGIKDRTDIPLAVLTNGSLFHEPEVREELRGADRVLPTLTTNDLQIWRRMHRPHRDLVLSESIRGLRDFREAYEGDLWVEVMMVEGLNDGEGSLQGLFKALQWVGPDRVDVLVPTRPPTDEWVEAPDPDRVLRAVELLGAWNSFSREADGSFAVDGYGDLREALLSIGSRHPLREQAAEDMSRRMGEPGAVTRLVETGEMVRVKYGGDVFLLPRHLTSFESVRYEGMEMT